MHSALCPVRDIRNPPVLPPRSGNTSFAFFCNSKYTTVRERKCYYQLWYYIHFEIHNVELQTAQINVISLVSVVGHSIHAVTHTGEVVTACSYLSK